ncbi:MAG: energy transducer TonB [Bryobacteraceae bacterium]|jgi:protein TonB
MRAFPIALTVLFAFNLTVYGEDDLKKLSKSEALAYLTSKPAPEYPPIARQLKIEGVVEMEAIVAEDGSVEQVNIVSGNPVLTKAATAAVKKWKFTPVKAEGKPVKALAPVSLSFKM